MKTYSVTINMAFETDDELTQYEAEYLTKEIFEHASEFSPTNLDIERTALDVLKIKNIKNKT